jgi:hypothetical protein
LQVSESKPRAVGPASLVDVKGATAPLIAGHDHLASVLPQDLGRVSIHRREERLHHASREERHARAHGAGGWDERWKRRPGRLQGEIRQHLLEFSEPGGKAFQHACTLQRLPDPEGVQEAEGEQKKIQESRIGQQDPEPDKPREAPEKRFGTRSFDLLP